MIILSQDHMSIYNTDDIYRIFVNKSSGEYVVLAEKHRMDDPRYGIGNVKPYPIGLLESYPLGVYSSREQAADVIAGLSSVWASDSKRFVMPKDRYERQESKEKK